MAIKKSLLEGKIYYRIVKVIVLVFPLLVILGVLMVYYKMVLELFSKDYTKVIQRDVIYVVYGVLGLALYYLLIKIIWRGFLYVVYGGLDNDIRKKVSQPTTTTTPGALTAQDKNEVSSLIALLIVLGCIFYAYFIYKSPEPIHITNGLIITNTMPSPKCVSTGCSNNWRCDGTYYIDGRQLSVHACFPSNQTPRQIYSSWSGTCRQCP